MSNQEKVWDKIAGPWNKYRTRPSPTVEKFVGSQKGRILDLGCGSGRNFIKVSGLKWVGVDFSEEMLKFAKENALAKKMKVELVRADSDNLPFDSDSFDSVLCFAVLHCVDSAGKRKKSVEEIFRVLKHGGEALISSWGSKSPRLKNKPKESLVPWTKKDGSVISKVKRYNYVYDLKELEDLAKKVGFEIVSSWEERNANLIVRKGK